MTSESGVDVGGPCTVEAEVAFRLGALRLPDLRDGKEP